MLVVSIGLEARYGATSRITYDLIAGLVIAVTGGLMFVPAFRVLLGLPPHLTAARGRRLSGRRTVAARAAPAAARTALPARRSSGERPGRPAPPTPGIADGR